MDAANGGAVAGWIRGSIVFEELGDLMAESGLEERDTRGVEGGGECIYHRSFYHFQGQCGSSSGGGWLFETIYYYLRQYILL